MEILLLGFLLGIFTGLVLGLTGSGGTIIAVPLLIFGLHATVAEAAPIALLSIALSATVATLPAFRQGIVRYRAAGLIATTGLLTAPIGIWIARQLPDSLLTLLFAGVLAFAAWYMYRQSDRSAVQKEELSLPCQLNLESGRLIWTLPCARELAFSGITTGFLSGLLGVGGGFIIIPALRKISNLPMQSLMATSLAITALISVTGVIAATSMGFMNWLLALPFSAGTITGTLIGRRYTDRFDEVKLQRGFAMLACCISLGMVIQTIRTIYS
jgi:uncharacterized membrane protein YfcA